jgi:hypothetical protein
MLLLPDRSILETIQNRTCVGANGLAGDEDERKTG